MEQKSVKDVAKADSVAITLHAASPATTGTENGSSPDVSGSGPDMGSESRPGSSSPPDEREAERGGGRHHDEQWQRAYARQHFVSTGVWCLVSLAIFAVFCLLVLQLRNDKRLAATLLRFMRASLALRLGGYS